MLLLDRLSEQLKSVDKLEEKDIQLVRVLAKKLLARRIKSVLWDYCDAVRLSQADLILIQTERLRLKLSGVRL